MADSLKKVREASSQIQRILMQLELDTGLTVEAMELQMIEMTGVDDVAPAVGRQVVITVKNPEVWLT